MALPEQFHDLEPLLVDWGGLATERARNRKRTSTPMGQIQAFYDVAFPRLPAMLEFLDTVPPDDADMPDEARELFHLCLALIEIATAVENYRQPTVIDGFDCERLVFAHEEPGSGSRRPSPERTTIET